jgi:predicted nucleic acid-binding protein
MKLVFADTFFWVAATNPLDDAHKRAIAYSESGRPTVTTEEVLMEYLNYFAEQGSHLRRRAASRVQQMLESSAVTVVAQSSASFRLGFDLYLRRMDKGYSLTDCVSMPAMRRMGISDVLTNDVHFDQEGFRAMFRSSE